MSSSIETPSAVFYEGPIENYVLNFIKNNGIVVNNTTHTDDDIQSMLNSISVFYAVDIDIDKKLSSLKTKKIKVLYVNCLSSPYMYNRINDLCSKILNIKKLNRNTELFKLIKESPDIFNAYSVTVPVPLEIKEKKISEKKTA